MCVCVHVCTHAFLAESRGRDQVVAPWNAFSVRVPYGASRLKRVAHLEAGGVWGSCRDRTQARPCASGRACADTGMIAAVREDMRVETRDRNEMMG